MSVISAWLIAHAVLIADSADMQLWQLPRPLTMAQVEQRFDCVEVWPTNQAVWCRTTANIWLFSYLDSTQYVRRFELPETSSQRLNQRGRADVLSTWFGEQSDSQRIDGYQIKTYQSQHRTEVLVNGFKLRHGGRIDFLREIEHGRYHLVLRDPHEDYFVIQQDQTTETIVISSPARPKPN